MNTLSPNVALLIVHSVGAFSVGLFHRGFCIAPLSTATLSRAARLNAALLQWLKRERYSSGRHQPSFSKYQSTVLLSPVSKVSSGTKPSSASIFDASIA